MLYGIIFSVIAGVFITLQSTFNTKVGGVLGLWETTTIVHITGLIASFVSLLIFGDGNIKMFNSVDKVYFLGGAFGVVIIFSVMKSFSSLGPTMAISILLITQLLAGWAIDTMGLFGYKTVPFHFTKPLGLIIMIIGIIVFKLRG